MFSPSPAHFGAEPNSNTNVIDLAYPGVLPVVNRRAVDWAMRASMALNMDIATNSKFDRKNYFYPDNPKAYQISQFDQPIGENGYIDIEVDGETKRIGITRLHMEEDAGKSTHKDGYSLVDLNRQGTPLMKLYLNPIFVHLKKHMLTLKNYVQSFNIRVYLIVKWKRAPYVVMLIFHFVHMVKRNLVQKLN